MDDSINKLRVDITKRYGGKTVLDTCHWRSAAESL